MAKLFDLVKVNTSTVGTGDITFGAPFSPGFFEPAEVGAVDGDVPRYVLVDGDDVELGVGLIKSSVTQMERTVLRSRIGGVAGTSKINLSGTAFLAFTAVAEDIVSSDSFATFVAGDLPWYAVPPGHIILVDTSIAGVSTPPQSHADLVYIELTAGKTGSGQYNEGKLTSESVTGSAPLTLATAVINVSGSPINGKTVNLLNTEGRILRPSGAAGTLQDDMIVNHTHGLVADLNRGSTGGSSWAYSAGVNNRAYSPNETQMIVGLSGRIGSETRMKNIGVSAFMRVK